MSIRRIATIVITAMLLVCLSVSVAFACECGGKHKTYGVAESKFESTTSLVKQAQNYLKTLGYKVTKVDGKMSSSLRSALKNFQYDAALNRTGKLNSCTLYRLEQRANAVKKNRSYKSWKNLFGGDYRLLQLKSSGSRVRTLNKCLYELGFGSSKIKNSSVFNSETYKAVVAFQKQYVKNRQADGKAGPYTLSTLERVYGAKKK